MRPRTFVAFDLETTGLNPKRDAIIEFGAVRFEDGGKRERFVTCVNPGRSIPTRIQQMTGIGPADVADAPAIEELIPEILAFIGGRTDAVVAHSAGFDVSFLRAAGVKINTPVLDTYELATILLPGQDSYSLGELCRALEIPLSTAHRAGHDAEATAELLLHLRQRIEALPSATLEALGAAGLESGWGPMLLFDDARSRRLKREESDGRGAWQEASVRRLPGPLNPRSSPQEIADTFLTAAFADDGALAAEFEGETGASFERRDGQLEMARLVLDALNRGDHKIIEAGTGTGKSLAYLLPAAAWAAANDSRVVIATNTIPLQDQLLEQELPRVTRTLKASGQPAVRAMALKGRSRYLCTRRLARWLEQPRARNGLPATGLSPLELRFLAKILVWLPCTRTGDLSELPVHDRREQALMAHVSSHGDECSPERCMVSATPGRHDYLGGRLRDFYLEAHRKARSAHLLVVNHALLLADVEAGGQVLPAYGNLIVDEAHHLENAATEQFTRQIDLGVLTSLLDALDDAFSQLAGRVALDAARDLIRQLAAERQAAQAILPTFFEALLDFVLRHCGTKTEGQATPRGGSGYPQQVALDNRVRAQPGWSEIEIEWDGVSAQLGSILERLTELAALLEGAPRQGGGQGAGEAFAGSAVELEHEPRSRAAALLQRAQIDLADLLQVADDVILRPLHVQERSVDWLELLGNGRAAASASSRPRRGADAVILRSAPIQVSEQLAADLFSPRRAVILTGATLQAGDRFDFLRDRLGCWDADGAVIDSPFDYKRNALLYMPGDMPTPDHNNYQHALEQAVQQAALAADGRTLVLFTSHSHLRATADAIRAPLAAAGLTVLQQGEGSRRRNLRDFRANPRSILLGTSSYWEGIDLPGDQLVCLLIARLPFAVPTDPLYVARSRLYEDAFHEYAVPEAVIRLRQGFGRLIRSASDRGVVVLLDSRLWQRSYGEIFLDALPACTKRHSPLSHLEEAVRDWLNRSGPTPVAGDKRLVTSG